MIFIVTIISRSPNTIRIPGFIWIPPSSPIYKIEVIRTDGTADDISDYLLDGTEFTLGTTEVIGVFTIKVDNSTGNYTDKWVAGNTVNLYLDYGSSATTKKFKGKIDKVSGSLTNQYVYTITGRATYASLREINVTKAFINAKANEILHNESGTGLFDVYSTGFTYSNIDTTSSQAQTLITTAFQGKPFWDCILEICQNSGMDCYIDSSDDVHFIAQNSATNTTDAIVVGQNHLETGEFGAQTDEVRNRIIVYGAEIDGIPQLWQVEDAISQGLYNGVKEEIVTNTNLTTMSEIQAYANYVLSLKKDPPKIGKVTSVVLCTLNPAELLKISDQINGLKSSYRVVSFTHFFGHTDIPRTEVTINREPLLVPKLFKGVYESQQSIADFKNEFDMKYSRAFTFDDETDTTQHINTSLSNGNLIWNGSGANGTFYSTNLTTSDNITSFEVKASGENLAGNVIFYVSVDGGNAYTTAIQNTQYSPEVGNLLKLKIVITNATVALSTVVILFK